MSETIENYGLKHSHQVIIHSVAPKAKLSFN